MQQQEAAAKVKLTVLCKSTTPLKTYPLPSSVYWNGKGGLEREKFIDKFAGHVTQQPHMGYILKEEIAVLWMKHVDPSLVLKLGMNSKIHPSLHHISPSQFIIDIVWLFGAMQQAITGRGRNIIREYELTQDGILCWKHFLDTHHYDGDVDVYLTEQQGILGKQFHPHYLGGMIQFLEHYESALVNI